MPVVPTSALMGQGIAELFRAAVNAVRDNVCPLPQPPSKHIGDASRHCPRCSGRPRYTRRFACRTYLLLMQVAAGDPYFLDELRQHFPATCRRSSACAVAGAALPRPLDEELHADRHHRAATLFEAATRMGAPHEGRGWRYWLDELFLHPRWGLVGSLAVFAAVLFVVFEVSAWIDAMTVGAPGRRWRRDGNRSRPRGVVGRAVVDGLIGLVGIVVPYMIPLVLLLVALEEAGVMQRIAFVVDRGFHQIGLHGGVAVPFLIGLGCNVPAISAAARRTRGRERVIASLLITFVPCSARSAIILALAGKYLGGTGVFAIFALTMVVIALLGRSCGAAIRAFGPGQVQEIPPYALPRWRSMLAETWERTERHTHHRHAAAGRRQRGAGPARSRRRRPRHQYAVDARHHVVAGPAGGAGRAHPVRRAAQGAVAADDLPGARHLRGRPVLDWVQIMTFLLFLTFYVPCISTFAVMLKTIGRSEALFSVSLSVGVALLVSGSARFGLEGARMLFT